MKEEKQRPKLVEKSISRNTLNGMRRSRIDEKISCAIKSTEDSFFFFIFISYRFCMAESTMCVYRTQFYRLTNFKRKHGVQSADSIFNQSHFVRGTKIVRIYKILFFKYAKNNSVKINVM